MTNYGRAGWRAKCRAWWPAWVVLITGITAAGRQQTHVVRLEVDVQREIYRFVPARVTVRSGDVVRFRVSSGAPHNIVFEGGQLPAGVREALNSAMPNRTGDLSGPILDRTGAEYRLVIPPVPPGRYAFYCTPHRAYDMRGELIVVE